MKINRMLMVLAALLFCFAAVSLAEGEIGLAVDTVSAKDGGRAEVSVALTNAFGMDSLQLNINYDPTALRLVEEPVVGGILDGALAVSNTDNMGMVAFAFASRDGLQSDGTALTLTFEVLTEVGSAIVVTDVQATTVDAQLKQHAASVTVTNGGVSIGDAALPAPVVTPWVAPTAAPTVSASPTTVPSPTPALAAKPTALPTAAPETTASESTKTMLPAYLLALGGIAAAIVIVWLLLSKKRKDSDPV